MRRKTMTNENGQSLIIVAFAMITLLMFSAFAVDLSYWYLQRRQMQNAADAGSLVGARALGLYQVDPTASLTNAQLYDIILDWARRNKAGTVQALYVSESGSRYPISAGDSSPAPKDYSAATGVHVKALVQVPTFFSNMLGLATLSASADAEARYDSAWSTSGLVPLAFRWMSSGAYTVGTEYTVFAGNDKNAPAQWGWLGLDCAYPSKCSPDANSLKDWMRNGYPGQVVRHTSYMGDPGMKASVLGQAYVGKYIILPLFDQVLQFTDDDLDNEGNPRCVVDEKGHPVLGQYEGWTPGHWDPNSYCATECNKQYLGVWCAHTEISALKNSYYYHIIEFAAFYVTGVSQGGHSLEGRFESLVTEGQATHPSIFDKGVIVVNLTQ